MTRSVRIVFVLAVCALLRTESPAAASTTPTKFVFAGTTKPGWVVVNDGVMGGVSSSKISTGPGVLRWSGRVRLENNGGFASARSPSLSTATNTAIAGGRSIQVRLRGTATAFNLTLQTAGQWYWATVTASPRAWTTIDIPYARFLPRTRFGEPRNGDAFAGQPLDNIGVLISNGRAETFRLDIDSVAIT